MQNINYNIDILVNDKPIRKFPHNNRLFVEARDGCEYSIRIKNNTWRRILACCSVDGLNILDGNQATENGPGYVLNGYSSNRYDGYRISDTQVAKFVFGKKGESYAASKEDGSEKNVGVIGVRIFEELIKPNPVPYIIEKPIPYPYPYPIYPPSPYWCETRYGTSDAKITFYGGDSLTNCAYGHSINTTMGLVGETLKSECAPASDLSFAKSVPPEAFDMGTKYGEAKESKVVEVTFEKGLLGLSLDIYYASRQSLIDMGVPIGNEKQVNFPKSFSENKYSTPPKEWKG